MVYIRHRDRMIQESVFEDLRNTLIAFRWLAGTTTRAVYPLGTSQSAPVASVVTTSESQTLRLLEGNPINLIDYFPDAEDGATTTPKNTFALDQGRPSEERELELGSRSVEQDYTFNMALYASSDAVASALLNDLRDRYRGLAVRADQVDLYDYGSDAAEPVQAMEVVSFRYERSVDSSAAPHEVNLYFAELIITDVNES